MIQQRSLTSQRVGGKRVGGRPEAERSDVVRDSNDDAEISGHDSNGSRDHAERSTRRICIFHDSQVYIDKTKRRRRNGEHQLEYIY
jgi:hypothetical protein